jgi:glucose/arabinose dehydrogenase
VSRSNGVAFQVATLGRKARYTDPQLSWQTVVAPTDLEFMKFNSMQRARRNDIFVGNISGDIYDLNLSATRKSLLLSGDLLDKVVDNSDENDEIRLGRGFGLITDLISRPDGLYVMNLDGDIYRIAAQGTPGPPSTSALTAIAVPEPSAVGLLALLMVFIYHRSARRQRI